MNRRAFVVGLGTLLAAPRGAEAQQADRVYRIGYLALGWRSGDAYLRPLEDFRRGLRELGWIEGRNIVIEYRYAEGRLDRLPVLADELIRLRVDVIAASPTPAAVAARNATQTIPIVGFSLTEPVAIKLVASLSRPGGNVTGVAYGFGSDIFGKQLELLREVDPRIRRVAVLYNPGDSPAQPMMLSSVKEAAASLGVELQLLEAHDPREFDRAFAEMSKARAQALWLAGPMFFQHLARLADLAVRNRLPSMSTQGQWVEAGGLLS